MQKRKELNTLVVMTLSDRGVMKASQMYDILRVENQKILDREGVGGLRSFVKIINQFPDICQKNSTGIREYVVKKEINNGKR